MIEGQGKKRQFWGKYEGTVTANNDTSNRDGRIKARVTDVYGSQRESGWARPCVPYAGENVGFFFLPPVGAKVWIEFEHGDPDRPIWTGCFWEQNNDLPLENYTPDTKVLKTEKATITIDDAAGNLKIEADAEIHLEAAGAKVILNNSQAHIERGNVKITLSQSDILISPGMSKIELKGMKVSINGNALEVT